MTALLSITSSLFTIFTFVVAQPQSGLNEVEGGYSGEKFIEF